MASPAASSSSLFSPSELEIPQIIQIKLHPRKGQPQIRCRSTKDLPDPQGWTHNLDEDSFLVIMERIKRRIADTNGFKWPGGGKPYIQPTHNSAQKNNQELDEGNFKERLVRAWRTEARRLDGDATQVFVHLYAYLTATGGGVASSTGRRANVIQRATRARLDAAHTLIADAVDQDNLEAIGPITLTHYARHLAKLPVMPFVNKDQLLLIMSQGTT
ncbi:hypothetical protein BC939DRAFT_505615 [Gamsiella multidivaricata]|uniref:uncharacterized protein n=1 Tax=Gamsiella multidivaricata TaxID=101098 RepID=UPI00221F7704|nr:uncharacterized protein BC939DRAFT_505615 [Gamsiella multidivaricata]KAI7819611.1 hypothetical protein BC939DRAFT_505615 [Gamsiella multidivaricata]